MLMGEFIALNTCIRKKKGGKINELNFQDVKNSPLKGK